MDFHLPAASQFGRVALACRVDTAYGTATLPLVTRAQVFAAEDAFAHDNTAY